MASDWDIGGWKAGGNCGSISIAGGGGKNWDTRQGNGSILEELGYSMELCGQTKGKG